MLDAEALDGAETTEVCVSGVSLEVLDMAHHRERERDGCCELEEALVAAVISRHERYCVMDEPNDACK